MKRTLLSGILFFIDSASSKRICFNKLHFKIAILIFFVGSMFSASYAQCSSAPSMPNNISGSATICQSSSQTYSISNVTGASSYSWSVSNGNLQITSGQGTNTITISAPGYNLTSNITVIATNSCGTTSKSISVSVVGPSVGGGVNRNGLNQICLNTNTGTMTLGNGYVGSVEKWQKRLNNAATWTDIANTTNTYSEVPSSAGTWEYRAYVSNYGCSPQYSSAYSMIVKPEVVITPAATAEANQFSTTATLSYTGNNSDQYYIKFDAAAVAAGISSNVQSGNISGANGNITIQIPACLATGTYNAILYADTNTPKCTSQNYSFKLIIKPNVTVGGTLSSDQTICNNTAPQDLVLTNGTMNSIIKWQSSTDAAFTNPYDIPSSANLRTLTSAKIGSLTQDTYFRVISQALGCNKTSSNAILITINGAAPATFTTTPPSTVCAGTIVTYTTQSGKSNYTWSVPGTANLDYEIQTGGVGTASNTVTLKWLTKGSKTVTVNYSNGCSVSANASHTTLVTKTLRGVVNGGKHICSGSTAPLLKLNNYEGTIVKWQYAEAIPYTWKDIANTSDTYQPGVLTTSTSYRAVVKSGDCAEENAIETRIDIEVQPTISSQSTATQTQCINGTFDPLTVTATGFEISGYQWYSNTTASNTSGQALGASNGARTNSYTPQSTTEGTLYYYCIVTGTCGTVTSAVSGAIITQKAPTAPTIGTVKQPNCIVSTGSVILENVPSSGRLIESRGTTYNYTTSGTSFEVTGLAPGTYKFAVNGCSLVYSADVIIRSANTWDGTKWSNGTPSITDKIEFIQNYNVDTDLNGCSCTVSNGANVTIPTGRTLTITNSVNVNSGSLTLENNSSLVQTDNVANTGNITYIRISPPIFQKDYLYWSTPVNPQKLVDVSPGTTPGKYFGNDGTQWVSTNRESNMVIGKGYIIRGPANYTNTTKQAFTATFKGVPNNGDLEGEALAAGKSYLVGNPYPSALNADELLKKNSMLNGTLYFWTHNTPAKPTATNQYTNDDYASYNLSGGVSAKSDKQHSDNPANDNGTKPTGKIAAGQSFFVTTNAAGKVQFKNAMRLGGTNNGQFFKPGNSAKETAIEKNRIWLNMTNATGAFKQVLVGYIEGATNDYETTYDGLSFDGNQYLDFYSVSNENKFVIQGRALPFTDTDKVPLGYRTTVEGEFTIAIDEVDGSMTNQVIYVEDKTTGEIHDLTQSNYTFKTQAGTFNDRLTLRYKTDKTLGTGDFENLDNGILVSVRNKTINLLSSKETIKDVTLFDITGKQIYTKKKIGETELQIQNLPSANQVLLVKVTLSNDFTTTRKIIFQ